MIKLGFIGEVSITSRPVGAGAHDGPFTEVLPHIIVCETGRRGRRPLRIWIDHLTVKPKFIFPLPQDHLCPQTNRLARRGISQRQTHVRADSWQAR